jgi:hypothetical protein
VWGWLLAAEWHLDDGHRVVAEDVDDFHRDFDRLLAFVGRAFVEGGREFKRAILLGAERLPFVFKDEVAGPDFFPRGKGLLIGLGAGDFGLGIRLE